MFTSHECRVAATSPLVDRPKRLYSCSRFTLFIEDVSSHSKFTFMKRSPLLVIFITVFIDLVGFGIVIPVLPFYAEGTKFGATPQPGRSAVRFILSVTTRSSRPILGRLSDKHGRRPILLVSLLGTALGFLILGFATTLLMLFVGRIIDGISGGNISTAQAYIADVTTKENRAKGMGLIGAAFGLGFVFGPAIGGILSRWGISVPFLFAGGLALANAVLLYFALPETITPDHPARTSAAAGRGWQQVIEALKQKQHGFRFDDLFFVDRCVLDHDARCSHSFCCSASVTTRGTAAGSSPLWESSPPRFKAD